jgi:hypothetical protein
MTRRRRAPAWRFGLAALLVGSFPLSGCALLVGSVEGDRLFDDAGGDSADGGDSGGKQDRRDEIDDHAKSDDVALDSGGES